MDEQRVTGPSVEHESRRDAAASGLTNGHADSLATVEPWSPPTASERASAAVRRYLSPGESLQLVDAVTRVDGAEQPASVGLTDDRLLVVSDDGDFVGVGLDRICSVRGEETTDVGVRGNDYRAMLALGYLLGVVGFLGVLATAANPLTPTLALVVLGGVFAVGHVLREGVDFDALVATIDEHDRDTGLGDRLRRAKRDLNDRVTDDDVGLGLTGGLAGGTFLLIVLAEGAIVPPFFTAILVSGAALTVYAMRHRERLDGVELVRRRQRTVRATVEDGTVLAVRTHPNSPLDRKLATGVQGRHRQRPTEDASA